MSRVSTPTMRQTDSARQRSRGWTTPGFLQSQREEDTRGDRPIQLSHQLNHRVPVMILLTEHVIVVGALQEYQDPTAQPTLLGTE